MEPDRKRAALHGRICTLSLRAWRRILDSQDGWKRRHGRRRTRSGFLRTSCAASEPGFAFGADLIAGLPGPRRRRCSHRSLDIIDACGIAFFTACVFPYSPREGTAQRARYAPQLDRNLDQGPAPTRLRQVFSLFFPLSLLRRDTCASPGSQRISRASYGSISGGETHDCLQCRLVRVSPSGADGISPPVVAQRCRQGARWLCIRVTGRDTNHLTAISSNRRADDYPARSPFRHWVDPERTADRHGAQLHQKGFSPSGGTRKRRRGRRRSPVREPKRHRGGRRRPLPGRHSPGSSAPQPCPTVPAHVDDGGRRRTSFPRSGVAPSPDRCSFRLNPRRTPPPRPIPAQ